MSLLPLLEQKDAVIKSTQYSTFMESRLFDQCNKVRVDVCHHLLEQQTQKIIQFNEALLKLFDTKNTKNKKQHQQEDDANE